MGKGFTPPKSGETNAYNTYVIVLSLGKILPCSLKSALATISRQQNFKVPLKNKREAKTPCRICEAELSALTGEAAAQVLASELEHRICSSGTPKSI